MRLSPADTAGESLFIDLMGSASLILIFIIIDHNRDNLVNYKFFYTSHILLMINSSKFIKCAHRIDKKYHENNLSNRHTRRF